jgi:hypothetical protein
MSGLCTLADVKMWLDVSNTIKDVKLQLFIDTISEQMISYLGYQARRTTYASEIHSINNNELLYLKGAPIQSVSSVVVGGVAVLPGSGDDQYQYDDTDAKAGRIYIGTGFCGNYYTRNMTYDPVAGMRSISVSYIAGWYLPEDTGYKIANAKTFNVSDSVPYAISLACIQEVVQKYRRNVARAEGLINYKEGGIAYGWGASSMSAQGNIGSLAGLSQECCAVLNMYRRFAIS